MPVVISVGFPSLSIVVAMFCLRYDKGKGNARADAVAAGNGQRFFIPACRKPTFGLDSDARGFTRLKPRRGQSIDGIIVYRVYRRLCETNPLIARIRDGQALGCRGSVAHLFAAKVQLCRGSGNAVDGCDIGGYYW